MKIRERERERRRFGHPTKERAREEGWEGEMQITCGYKGWGVLDHLRLRLGGGNGMERIFLEDSSLPLVWEF